MTRCLSFSTSSLRRSSVWSVMALCQHYFGILSWWNPKCWNRLVIPNSTFIFREGTLIVTCVGIPWICLLLLPLGFIYFNLQHYYRNTSRELKRLSTITLSPIYSQFSETLSGLVTIRATQSSARFIRRNHDLVESNNKTQFASQAAAQWLSYAFSWSVLSWLRAWPF